MIVVIRLGFLDLTLGHLEGSHRIMIVYRNRYQGGIVGIITLSTYGYAGRYVCIEGQPRGEVGGLSQSHR